MILYAHLFGQDKRERIIVSCNVEKDAERAGMTLDDYLKKIMEMNPQFERIYCR